MKSDTKSSITLSAAERKLVTVLKARLGLESNIEVVRRGLRLLEEVTDRQALKEAYRKASAAGRKVTSKEIEALDYLASEGLD